MRNLERDIQELIDMPTEPKSEWIRKFENANESAIAGAILHWKKSGSLIQGADNVINKREAASAILQTRLASQVTHTMETLDKSADTVTKVGLLLAVIGIVIGVLQLISG
ncbi:MULTISPECIES: hypothetical protein [Vibrio]|uniref:Uncharacterized protein n=1 Tax=Vibrio aestuarianus TaxID=28171 RepID=A0A9X4EXX4_9VIBR|nr:MULTISPECIES: hypothetical protein [Vibrio]ASG01660.1 hypothetical protein CEG15_16045 [Vibrio anguillarum]MBT2949734.1 hypothetical protein [Vibrio anguillarum]MDE1244246.1 hypothetical protein [Vibrio aestuarianus]